MLDAVVFDFDLTLADSATAVIECSGHAMRLLGFEAAEPEKVRRTIGLTLAQSFVALTGVRDPVLEAAYARLFISRADEVMVAGTKLYPGVPELLTSLRAYGVGLGIVSGKLRHRIEAILGLAGLGGTVDVVLGAEDVTEHKPDPQGILAALSLLKAEPARSLYVGDHPVDAQAAGRAGVAFVAVRTGSSQPEDWGAAVPLEVIDSASALLTLLEHTGRLGRGAA